MLMKSRKINDNKKKNKVNQNSDKQKVQNPNLIH